MCLRTFSTCTRTPPSHTPTLAWPEAEAATQSQGLDDDDDDGDSLHPPRMHRPHGFRTQPVVGTQLATLFDPQRDHWLWTSSGMKPVYGLTQYIFLPFLFVFIFFLLHACHTDRTGQPGGAETCVNLDMLGVSLPCHLTWFFLFLFLFLFFFLAVALMLNTTCNKSIK